MYSLLWIISVKTKNNVNLNDVLKRPVWYLYLNIREKNDGSTFPRLLW